jgi:hypothetical protein
MLTRHDILIGFIVPAMVSAAILYFAWLATRDPSWSVPIAVGVGFLAGSYFLFHPTFPPRDSVQWLAWAAPVAAAAGTFHRGMTRGASRRGATGWFVNLIVVAALAGAIVWLMLRPLFGSSWEESRNTGVIWIAAITFATALWSALLDAQAARDSGPAFALAMTIVLGLASATIAMTGSQSLGQIGGILTAAVGAVSLFSFFLRGVSLARGGTIPIALLFVPLLAASMDGFFSNMPRHYAAGLIISPLGCWLAELPVVRRQSPVTRGSVRLLASVVPAAIVTAFATLAFRRAMAESGELGWQ